MVEGERDEVTRAPIATGGAHAGMVGGGQAQPVAEAQATHASEIKGVAMGDGAALAAIAARRGAAGARMLAAAAHVVAGTPGREETETMVGRRVGWVAFIQTIIPTKGGGLQQQEEGLAEG